jgi:hypothetical protein
MSLTIEQIEEQIATLQENLEALKNQKLKVSRNFSGQYFEPYQGILYRRMESDGVPIWEAYIDTKKEWTLLNSKEIKDLEKIYQKECVVTQKETPQESLEEFMK